MPRSLDLNISISDMVFFLFLTSIGHVVDSADVPHYFLQLRKVKNFWEDASGFLSKSPKETVSSAKLNLKGF